MFRYERDMRQPVIDWLSMNGYVTAVEFWLVNHPADLVAGEYGARPASRRVPPLLSVVAVELKLSDVAGVIRQAEMNWHACDFSLCAMPSERIRKMQRSTITKFSAAGVGLLSVGESITDMMLIVSPSQGKGIGRRVRHLVP